MNMSSNICTSYTFHDVSTHALFPLENIFLWTEKVLMELLHMLWPCWHRSPLYSSAHWHRNSLGTRSWHWPPFWQGRRTHDETSARQEIHSQNKSQAKVINKGKRTLKDVQCYEETTKGRKKYLFRSANTITGKRMEMNRASGDIFSQSLTYMLRTRLMFYLQTVQCVTCGIRKLV